MSDVVAMERQQLFEQQQQQQQQAEEAQRLQRGAAGAAASPGGAAEFHVTEGGGVVGGGDFAAGASSDLVSSGNGRVVTTSTGDLLGMCEESRPLRITGLGLGDAAKRTVAQLLKDEFDGLALMQPAPGMLGMLSPQAGLTAVNLGGSGTRVQTRGGAGGAGGATPQVAVGTPGLQSAPPPVEALTDPSTGAVRQPAPDGTMLNASHVEGGYIASEAPRDEVTGSDFWRMAWQQRVGAIVMLCNLVEGGEMACARYWPEAEGQALSLGGFTVFHKASFTIGEIMCRSLLIRENESQSGEIREIVQLHCADWPDAGIPASTKPVEDLIVLSKKVRQRAAAEHGLNGPCIVHCSDGLGRTGSFVACDVCATDVLMRRLPRIPHTVHRLREQRPGLVQTVQQHALIYAVVADVTRATGFDLQKRIDSEAAGANAGGLSDNSHAENLLLSFLVMAKQLAASREGPGATPAVPGAAPGMMILPTPITDSGTPISQPGQQQTPANNQVMQTPDTRPQDSYSSASSAGEVPAVLIPAGDGPGGFALNLRADSTGEESTPSQQPQTPGMFSLQLH